MKRVLGERIAGDLVASGVSAVASSPEEMRRDRRANLHILFLLAVILAPLAYRHWSTGEWLPAAAALVLSAVFVANLWLILRRRSGFLSPPTVLLITIPLVILSVMFGQEYSLFWMYPLMVAVPSILSTGAGMWLGALCLMVVIPAGFLEFETGMALIMSVSMIHTLLGSWSLMRAVNQQSSRYRNLVIHDALTGAKNRRHFEEELASAFSLWQRHKRISALIMLDVDHFKAVNDELGHAAGDEVLKALVALIQERIRGADTVFRYGGEEFAILLPETTVSRALVLANELRDRVKTSHMLPERRVTISLGVCDPSVAESADDWLRQADAALYRAKAAGRDRAQQVASLVQLPEPLGDALPIWR